MDIRNTLLTLMYQGGWVMWALLIFSIVALAVAVERSIALKKAGTDLDAYLSKLQSTLLKQRSIGDALEATEATPGVVARVAETGLRRFSRSPAQLEKALERRAQSEVRRLDRRLKILATTATTAPLLGFLGTVTGMMGSFEILADFGTSNPGLVANGIKEALTTTAAGLVVAVPAQLAYSSLSSPGREDHRRHRSGGELSAGSAGRAGLIEAPLCEPAVESWLMLALS